MNALGIVAGLATAFLWAFTAICFEAATKRLGTLTVNVLRLLIAAALFLGLSVIRTGAPLPSSLSAAAWLDLTLSGLVGFVVGDLLLFQAFADIGAKLSMLVYASVPAMTSVAGVLFLGERLTLRAILGMVVTVTGITVSVLNRKAEEQNAVTPHRRRGLWFALGGAVGQTAGLLLGKRGALGVDAFSATEIRVLAGLGGFFLVLMVNGKLKELIKLFWTMVRHTSTGSEGARRETHYGLAALCLGAILGPFLGVSLGLKSMQLLPAGVAATLMAMVPVLLIPISAVLFREKTTLRESLGAVVAIFGVAILAT